MVNIVNAFAESYDAKKVCLQAYSETTRALTGGKSYIVIYIARYTSVTELAL